jgi:hypothetical protein
MPRHQLLERGWKTEAMQAAVNRYELCIAANKGGGGVTALGRQSDSADLVGQYEKRVMELHKVELLTAEGTKREVLGTRDPTTARDIRCLHGAVGLGPGWRRAGLQSAQGRKPAANCNGGRGEGCRGSGGPARLRLEWLF